MRISSQSLFLVGVLFLFGVGCSSNTVTLTPIRRGPVNAMTPTPKATSTSVTTLNPTPMASSSAANIAAVTTALQGVETYFATLPHQNSATDLASLASHMVSSGAFSAATVSYGGINAITAGGTQVLIFADRPEALGYTTSASQRVAAVQRQPAALPAAVSPPNTHEVGFLVNTSDAKAFNSAVQSELGLAFKSVLKNSVYNVDVLNMTLESIVALQGHQLDYLNIATHGLVTLPVVQPTIVPTTPPKSTLTSELRATSDTPSASPAPSTTPFYAWYSDTHFNASTLATYSSDYAAGRIIAGIQLQYPPTPAANYPSFAFTPAFLTAHLTFNPGAIVDNQSCFGASPAIVSSVTSMLQGANVGKYTAWTKAVEGGDADQNDAFVIDRLLGEATAATTGMDQLAIQRSPPQRPFPFDDIESIVKTEPRAGPLGTGAGQSSEPYSISDDGDPDNLAAPPVTDGTKSIWISSHLGGESLGSLPLLYSLPSISMMTMDSESATNGTLDIFGTFPMAQGSVTITDDSGTENAPVVTWTSQKIQVTLNDAATSGSYGGVQVIDATQAIGSNIVPLTQWSGTLTSAEKGSWSMMGTGTGTGSGTIATSYTVWFRDDVHPTVPSVDVSPVPQNLTFPNVEGNSTSQVTAISGTFATSDGMYHATLGMVPSQPILVPGVPPLSNSFYVRAVANQPTTCNNALPGPQAGPTNVFCPGVAYRALLSGTCTDDDNGELCASPTWNVLDGFGVIQGINDGLVTFTMNPTTYAIAVSGIDSDLQVNQFEASSTLTGGVLGTINAPLSAPTSTTPALKHI